MNLIELFFFAYRDFVVRPRPDPGRARLRAGPPSGCCISWPAGPGLPVADLLDVLKITKQSLNRVLKELVDQGLRGAAAPVSRTDRRQRLLFATRGRAGLWRSELARLQSRRIRRALARDVEPELEEACGTVPVRHDRSRRSSPRCVHLDRRRYIDRHERAPHRDARPRGRISWSWTTTGACASCSPGSSASNGYRVTNAASASEARAKMRERRLRRDRARRDDAGRDGVRFPARPALCTLAHPGPDADPPGPSRPTGSRGWRSGPTTTCRSPSSRASCCCASRNIIKRVVRPDARSPGRVAEAVRFGPFWFRFGPGRAAPRRAR